MFDLDIRLFSCIYTNCKALGNVFGFGAFEGFVIYSGIILIVITEVMSKRSKKC
ncbi:hypothetical protein [Clostridium botulinum]|uniref:hypothetical protein n=1 Tax=Clostridium botulinum TaxID=1491 RepID=UPI00196768F1|nr:hypothetical protein [Clostridium botulinum]